MHSKNIHCGEVDRPGPCPEPSCDCVTLLWGRAVVPKPKPGPGSYAWGPGVHRVTCHLLLRARSNDVVLTCWVLRRP